MSVQVIPFPKGDARFDPATGEFTFSIDVLITGTDVTPQLNGWVIQKLTIVFQVYECKNCDCKTGRQIENRRRECEGYWNKTLVYLEAWQVVNGRVYHGKASDNDPAPQDTFKTGAWNKDQHGKLLQVCGTITITGELKFFKASGLDPLLDPRRWKPKDKAMQSGRLPSTVDEDSIDAFGPKPKVPKSREHVLQVTFDNCAQQATFVGRVVRQSPKIP